MKELKNGLGIRGDSLYCPLSFTLDTYGNCLTYCYHCYFRRLNHVWGNDLKPLDIELFRKKLENGIKNTSPRASISTAIHNRNTIRVGNKTDPYQTVEKTKRVTRKALQILKKYHWDVIIQTKFTENLMADEDIILSMKANIMPVISPGLDRDWEILEKGTTTPPMMRLKHAVHLQRKNLNVGINGEPFIPGFHTVKDFEDIIKLLKTCKIKSYNTYNLHLNDWVAKNLHHIGLDIEKIWFMNQDAQWKKILPQLIDIAKKYNIRLGCPDFVHSGSYQEDSNTCCGVNVKKPTTFNVVYWKKIMKKTGFSYSILEKSWDGIGDYEEGKKLFEGKKPGMYSLKDIKVKGLFK
jgi:DNA repair photolyase